MAGREVQGTETHTNFPSSQKNENTKEFEQSDGAAHPDICRTNAMEGCEVQGTETHT
ncbi:MAG: hypothetical protein JXR82_05775 [Marinifilaceae bacterium]|nr:hypothetical protein [Marinifilaceae bacterium]